MENGARSELLWNPDHFDFEDHLNQEIWISSPHVQREIQPPESLTHIGAFGAQQAMLPSSERSAGQASEVLPWVPDLLGRYWRAGGSLLVVGSAYAGFICELSRRNHCMQLADYRNAVTVEDFQRHFLESVVRNDRSYYDRIVTLLPDKVNATGIALFDLCRASFVQRSEESHSGRRRDKWRDRIVQTGADIYNRYLTHDRAADWLWRRIADTESGFIVALGTIAEHGLLRFFRSRVEDLELQAYGTAERCKLRSFEGSAWVKEYADPSYKLGYWIDHEAWWTVTGRLQGEERSWRVLPVHHPSSLGRPRSIPSYARTKDVLVKMMGCSC